MKVLETKNGNLYHSDCLEIMKQLEDNSIDLILTDPPYSLSSTIFIRPDGKPDYDFKYDFLNVWEVCGGDFWESFFKEANRILKHGGYCLMFGMDRQTFLFKYYANYAGFIEAQSLYWYYVNNFPKYVNLNKELKKRGKENIAEKYDGYYYSNSVLKQTCETIMVFKKKNKTGSVINDIIELENGDTTITCNALNIKDNVIPIDSETIEDAKEREAIDVKLDGRYPSQTFLDENTANILDKQSGIKKSVGGRVGNKSSLIPICSSKIVKKGNPGFNDVAGCSKICHKIKYEEGDFDIFIYNTKPSVSEKEKGCENLEEIDSLSRKYRPHMKDMDESQDKPYARLKKRRNIHPTVKPIRLIEKILNLFKSPYKQIVLDPFIGSGTTAIACERMGMNWIGIEKNETFCKIASERIKNNISNNLFNV